MKTDPESIIYAQAASAARASARYILPTRPSRTFGFILFSLFLAIIFLTLLIVKASS